MIAMRRCRNRSNDLIHGGRWWWWWTYLNRPQQNVYRFRNRIIPLNEIEWNWMLSSYWVLIWTAVLLLCWRTAVAQWLRCSATIGRSLVRPPLVSLEFFIDIKSFRSHYGPGVDSDSNRNEDQELFLGVKAAGDLGWQPYHHPVPLSRNLGTLTSWNPLGLSRPVNGTDVPFTFIMLLPVSEAHSDFFGTC